MLADSNASFTVNRLCKVCIISWQIFKFPACCVLACVALMIRGVCGYGSDVMHLGYKA